MRALPFIDRRERSVRPAIRMADVEFERRARPPRRPREPILTVEGRFDLAAALRVVAAVHDGADGARATIDLRRAPVDDVAIAVLARELEGRPVTVLGLTRHHERLLRYLGADAAGRGVADG